MKEWMPWHATKQQKKDFRQRRACHGIQLFMSRHVGKIETMLQHEEEHVEACKQSFKDRIEYAETYYHVCCDMSPEAGKNRRV